MLTAFRRFAATPAAPTLGPITVTAANGTAFFMWACTGRGFTLDDSPNMEAMRTSIDTYAVGLKEKIQFIANDTKIWFHRRIVFATKGLDTWALGVNGLIDFPTAHADPAGISGLRYYRGFIAAGTIATSTTDELQARQHIEALLFKGAVGADWSQRLTAPVNTQNVNLMYDKTHKIASSNPGSAFVLKSFWHPIKRRLIYADQESGKDEIPAENSSRADSSVGDVYIYDIFQPSIASGDSALQFVSDATYYWHEK